MSRRVRSKIARKMRVAFQRSASRGAPAGIGCWRAVLVVVGAAGRSHRSARTSLTVQSRAAPDDPIRDELGALAPARGRCERRSEPSAIEIGKEATCRTLRPSCAGRSTTGSKRECPRPRAWRSTTRRSPGPQRGCWARWSTPRTSCRRGFASSSISSAVARAGVRRSDCWPSASRSARGDWRRVAAGGHEDDQLRCARRGLGAGGARGAVARRRDPAGGIEPRARDT
jgi:hypothetical protein